MNQDRADDIFRCEVQRMRDEARHLAAVQRQVQMVRDSVEVTSEQALALAHTAIPEWRKS